MKTFIRSLFVGSSIVHRRLWLVGVAIVLTRTSLLAHDMWIDPMTFFPESGQVVGVRLRVGQDLIGDPLPRDPALINQFVVQDDSGRQPLMGRDGVDPAGFLRIAAPGLLVVAYHSKPSAVELASDKFNQYLTEEGLEAVAALRAQRNETGAKAREMFSRCAKSLLLAGTVAEGQGDRSLGLPIELVAEGNPYALPRRPDIACSPDVREPAAAGRARRGHQPSEPFREAVGAQRQRGARAVPVATERDVAGQGRPHGTGSCR